MLTPRENFLETIRGGKPDRYVNQYEALGMIMQPIGGSGAGAMKPGDEIVTIGGFVGRVLSVKEDTVTFETGEDRVRIQIKKWGISTTAKMEAAEAAARANKGKK